MKIEMIREAHLAVQQHFSIEEFFETGDAQQQYQMLKKTLSQRLTEMIEHEFDAFVNLLYRIDLSETQVKKTLAENPFEQAVEIIAELIIVRQLQKIETRKKYSSGGNDLSFDI